MLVTILYAGSGKWSWLVKIRRAHSSGVSNSLREAWQHVNEFIGDTMPPEPDFKH